MDDLISRQAAIMDAESWVAVDEYEKHLQKKVVEWLKEFTPAKLSTNLAEVGTDCISRQAAIDAIAGCTNCGDEEQLRKYVVKHGLENGWTGGVLDALDAIYELPSAQPEQRTCVNCGRTVNNGGWYADGGTRCPIEEHYALPKDGYCHLWEKRNVTDDDYPERRTDG